MDLDALRPTCGAAYVKKQSSNTRLYRCSMWLANGKDWERNDFWLLGVERVSLRMAWRGMRGRKGDHAELSVEQSCGKSAKRSLPATTPELRLLWLFFNATKVEISLENVGSA